MDSIQLAQTLVNVATNLMEQQQQQQFGPGGGFSTNRAWNGGPGSEGLLGPGPAGRGQDIDLRGGGVGCGSGLLGEGPGDNNNFSRRQSSGSSWSGFRDNISRDRDSGPPAGGHKMWSSEYNGKKEPKSSKKHHNRPQKQTVRSIDTKNYLPKIKEDGQKPHYYPQDYADVPGKYLQCSLCKKDPMRDGESFKRHLLGNTHNQKVEEMIEEDVKRVAKLREVITLFYRTGEGLGDKKCGLCEVKVKDIIKHRSSHSHKQLKLFIHPHCQPCGADFEDRVDWYYHQFSGYHLQNLDACAVDVDYTPISSRDIDKVIEMLSKKAGVKQDKEVKDLAQKHVDEDGDVIIVDEENNATKNNDDEEESIVGTEYIKPVHGMFCKLCEKFFLNDKSEIVDHCRTSQHIDSVQIIEKATGGVKRKSASEFFNASNKKFK